jgi:hypothetical protein
VADHDGRLPDAVVGLEGDGEALPDAGAGEHRVVGGVAAGQCGRMHGVSGGFEETRPWRQQRRHAEHAVQEQDRWNGPSYAGGGTRLRLCLDPVANSITSRVMTALHE